MVDYINNPSVFFASLLEHLSLYFIFPQWLKICSLWDIYAGFFCNIKPGRTLILKRDILVRQIPLNYACI